MLAPVRVGLDLLVVEGDAPVERENDDSLEARRRGPQALGLLENAAGRSPRRREPHLRLVPATQRGPNGWGKRGVRVGRGPKGRGLARSLRARTRRQPRQAGQETPRRLLLR